MDVCPSTSFVCFICKATAISRQANGLSRPAVEEGLCRSVSTEIEVRRDLAARHIVDASAKGPGITRRAYEALNWPYYSAHRLMFRRTLQEYWNIDEQIFLWHHGFRCLYATLAQGANCVIPFVSSDRYWKKYHRPSSAADWLRTCPTFLSRAVTVIDVPEAYDSSPYPALTVETKKEAEDEFKYFSIETTSLDERVWTAPRYSVEPRFYSHLSVEQTSHVQNDDINPSRRTDELDHFTRPRRTNELASPADLRLSNELRNDVTMRTPGCSPAPLIKASPSMSNAFLYDMPSTMASPAQPIEAACSMDSYFRLFDPQQTRANTQSSAHYDFLTIGENSQLRYPRNLRHLLD